MAPISVISDVSSAAQTHAQHWQILGLAQDGKLSGVSAGDLVLLFTKTLTQPLLSWYLTQMNQGILSFKFPSQIKKKIWMNNISLLTQYGLTLLNCKKLRKKLENGIFIIIHSSKNIYLLLTLSKVLFQAWRTH